MNEKTSINCIYPDLWLPTAIQSITRFDCHKAVCLSDDVHECLWIQEATGEVWISLKQNIIDTAVNKCGKRLKRYTRLLWEQGGILPNAFL